MNFLRSPKHKLLLATAAVLVLALLSPVRSAGAASAARLVLGAAAVGGLAWWFLRQKKAGFALAAAPRLQVLSRTGLSQRCGMALVQADGEHYLVVFGDGFAEVQPARAAQKPKPKVLGRRVRPRRARKGGAR